MLHPQCPGKAFVSSLISVRVAFKRLVTMSVPKLSEESSERPTIRDGFQIDAHFSDVVTSDTAGENDQARRKFTEEVMVIHRLHRESCEVRGITSVSGPV